MNAEPMARAERTRFAWLRLSPSSLLGSHSMTRSGRVGFGFGLGGERVGRGMRFSWGSWRNYDGRSTLARSRQVDMAPSKPIQPKSPPSHHRQTRTSAQPMIRRPTHAEVHQLGVADGASELAGVVARPDR